MKVAVFLLYSFFIPQIVHCVRTDCRQPLQPLYVVGMSITRLALPLYLFSCPQNLLRVAPSHGVSVGLTLFVGAQVRTSHTPPPSLWHAGWVLTSASGQRIAYMFAGHHVATWMSWMLQAGILLLQYYYGSRCFIPKVIVASELAGQVLSTWQLPRVPLQWRCADVEHQVSRLLVEALPLPCCPAALPATQVRLLPGGCAAQGQGGLQCMRHRDRRCGGGVCHLPCVHQPSQHHTQGAAHGHPLRPLLPPAVPAALDEC